MTTAADVGFVEMRVSKVVGLRAAEEDIFECIVLDEVGGNRCVVIQTGSSEAFSRRPPWMVSSGAVR
jgi:hypothetical protein